MCALETSLLPKIVSFQNHILLTKCDYLVYEMTKYDINRTMFSLRFLDMIHVYENCQTFYYDSSKF